MKFEICLNDFEQKTLRGTIGYYPLPELLAEKNIPLQGLYKSALYAIPYSLSWKVEGGKLRQEQNRILDLMEGIWLKYPKPHPITPEDISPIRIADARDILNEEDQNKYENLVKEYEELSNKITRLAKRERRLMERTLRNLYGVIGIVRGHGNIHKYFYKYFVIPSENSSAVRNSMETGIFDKEINLNDISLLEFLLERTREIRAGKTKGYNPEFSIPRIMKEYIEKDRALIRASLSRLTGILCHAYGPNTSPYNLGGEVKPVYWDNWFIPFNRTKLAESIIRK